MLDVNVVLDFTLKRTQYEKAKEIIALAVHNKVEAFITPSMIHIAGYWLSKEYGAGMAKNYYQPCFSISALLK